MSTAKENPVGAITLALAWIVSLPVLVFYRAYVFSYLWLWFVVPFGAPAIGIAMAIGLLVLKGFLTYEIKPTNKAESSDKELSEVFQPLLQSYLAPTFIFGIGYFVSLYV